MSVARLANAGLRNRSTYFSVMVLAMGTSPSSHNVPDYPDIRTVSATFGPSLAGAKKGRAANRFLKGRKICVLHLSISEPTARDARPGTVSEFQLFGKRRITSLHRSVGGLDVSGKSVFGHPVVILGHAQFLLNLIEEPSIAHHLGDSFKQQFIILIGVVKDFGRSRGTMPGNHGFQDAKLSSS